MKRLRRPLSLLLILCLVFGLLPGCLGQRTPDRAAARFLRLLCDKNYAAAYKMLTEDAQGDITKDDFINRYTSIFSAIGLTALDTSAFPMQYGEHDDATLPYVGIFQTTKCGKFSLHYSMELEQESGDWKIDWTPGLIFPGMDWGDKVVTTALAPKRGEIFGSDSTLLAGNAPGVTAYATISEIADPVAFSLQAAPLLGMASVDIRKAIASKKLAGQSIAILKSFLPDALTDEVQEQLKAIPGLGIDTLVMSNFRSYPLSKYTAHIIGYIGQLSAQDIARGDLKGYSLSGVIGKSGLEQKYDKQLRGKDGYTIYILDKDGAKKSTVYTLPAQDGSDIVTTIDGGLQQKAGELADEFMTDKCTGAVVVLDPTDGAVKACLSWPSFDPNQFNLKLTTDQWKALQNQPGNPLYNRPMQALLPPGSTFKPFTALMGLDSGVITTSFQFTEPIHNNVWHPYGKANWKITRIPFGNGPLNLHRAIVYSDNIYFAYTALQLGRDRFINYAQKFGFTDTLPFDLPVGKPQITGKDKRIYSQQGTLADSGYGQGDILISPMQMAAMFTLFPNKGTMARPYIISSYNKTINGRLVPTETPAKPPIWKTGLVTDAYYDTLTQDMVDTVDYGTGDRARVEGMTIAGKTGTAQMGAKTRAIGWYMGYILQGGKKYLVCVCTDGSTEDISAKFYVAKGIFEYLKTPTTPTGEN